MFYLLLERDSRAGLQSQASPAVSGGRPHWANKKPDQGFGFLLVNPGKDDARPDALRHHDM